MEIFTLGNHKLPRSTLIWNLPSGKSCPGCTSDCQKYCYAKKAEKCYPQVLPFRNRNFRLSKHPFFKLSLMKNMNRKKFHQVRIHESGDFYSQPYINCWYKVIKYQPSKIFYAYTKSFHLDFKTGKPENFLLYASDDKYKFTNAELLRKGYNGRAVVIEDKNYVRKMNEFFCPGDCKICDMCYNKSTKMTFKSILFHKH